MRWTKWRRLVAVVAMVVGVGVGASTVPASASTGTITQHSTYDIWW
jgi:hypothetical protein